MSHQIRSTIATQFSSQRSFKITFLIVFTWIFLTVFQSGNVSERFRAPSPTLYYKTEYKQYKRTRGSNVDISFLDDIEKIADNLENGKKTKLLKDIFGVV